MRFTNKFLVVLALVTTTLSFGAVERRSMDLRLPTQAMVEYQRITQPALGTSTYVVSLASGNTGSGAATLSSFSAQPDVPRNLLIHPGGSTGNVASCTITVSGTDFLGQSITEDFAFTATQATSTVGAKAFKTVSSVAFPAGCEASPYGASWSIGVGSKLGLKRCIDNAGRFFHASLGGTKESTAPTVVAGSSTAVSSNTVSLSSALNGTDVDLYYVQNFRCLP